jgi:hypothetical protein
MGYVKRKRWLQPPKLIALGAAVAVGIFLSVASHAFGWSAGSTFAVACALVALLAMFGPAVFLQGQAESTVPSLVFVSQPTRPGMADWDPAAALYINRTYRPRAEPAQLAYGALRGLEDRSQRHANNPGDTTSFRETMATQPEKRELTRAQLERDLGQFVALAGRHKESLDPSNVGLLDRPDDVAVVGLHG